jgi:hypothetical protein
MSVLSVDVAVPCGAVDSINSSNRNLSCEVQFYVIMLP